jgi:hypothetical protein
VAVTQPQQKNMKLINHKEYIAQKQRQADEWWNSEEGQNAVKRLTEDVMTEKDWAENHLRMSLRKIRKERTYLSLFEIEQILLDEFPHEDLKVLIKQLEKKL